MVFSKKTAAIFWDNDGVLAATEQIYYQACRLTLADMGLELTKGDFKEYSMQRGVSSLHLADEMFTEEQLKERSKQLVSTYSKLLENIGPEILRPGVKEIIEYFYGNTTMGIVTSSRKVHFDLIHRNLPLTSRMDFILTYEDFTNTKPDPEPYLKALKVSGIAPEHCVVIEDSPRGIAAARAAGLDVIAITSEFFGKDELQDASEVISDLLELKQIIIT